MNRLTVADAAALEAAIEQAQKGLAEGGIPIGSALATADGTIVAAGHNRRVQDGDPTAHAETACVRAAGRRRDWSRLIMATTLSPCAMCSGTIVLLGVRRVIIGEHETFIGREDWLRAEGVELVVADDARCREMMQRFIAEQPSLWNEDIGVED